MKSLVSPHVGQHAQGLEHEGGRIRLSDRGLMAECFTKVPALSLRSLCSAREGLIKDLRGRRRWLPLVYVCVCE